MMEIFDIDHSMRWDDIVRSFPSYDVYYLSGYVRPFMLHGEGNPRLLYYESDELRAIYVYILRSTDIEGLYDTITPYGYGGILFDGNTSNENVSVFWEDFVTAMKDQGIVNDFVRYHPVLDNASLLKGVVEIVDLGKTIALDLSSPEVIWDNMTSKKKGKIRKAEKNGIVVNHGQGMDLFDEFIKIYNATMDKNDATSYYYFDRPFYEAIHESLKNNYEIFYGTHDSRIIMIAIMLHCNGKMHYHLSGSLLEYRNLEPNNLLLYKAALWGCEKGFKTLHLGGGVDSCNDALFEFKKGFNRNEDYQFSIGRQIFDQEGYDRLVELRMRKDKDFNGSTSFFPSYRANQH